MGQTPRKKFGAMFGCHSEPGSESGGDAFWNNYTSGPPWTHRVKFVDIRGIPNTGVSTDPGLATLTTFAERAEALALFDECKFSGTNNISVTTVDPIKGGAGAPTVTGVGTVGTGDDALCWHSVDKPENARWKAAVIANYSPNLFPISMFMPGNEPPGNSMRVCAYAPGHVGSSIGQFSNNSFLDTNTVISRHVILVKAVYEELKTPNRKYTRFIHNSPLSGYQNNGSHMQSSQNGGDGYTAYQMYNYNNGEILNYINPISTHVHNRQCYFDLTSTAGTLSYYHLWTAIRQGETASGTLGKHAVCNDETGVRSGDHESSPVNSLPNIFVSPWNDPPTAANLEARLLITMRRLGLAAVSHFYWGLSHIWVWGHNLNTHGDFWAYSFFPHPSYTPIEPKATLLQNAYSTDAYAVEGRWPWTLAITAKPWTDYTSNLTKATRGFHYGPTWAILADVNVPEKADPASPTARSWYEWDRATITDNQIAFTAPVAGQGRQVNQAARPVVLPGFGTYYAGCKVTGNMGVARIIARGYDLTNGLAHTIGQAGSETSAASADISVSFTAVPHIVKNFPNLPRVVIVLEANQAAQFSDVWLSPKPTGPIAAVAAPPLLISATGTPTSGPAPLTVAFSVAQSGGDGSYTDDWVFGDGQIGSGATISHTYTSNGAYDAVVSVSSGSQTATDSVHITVTSSTNEQDTFLNPFTYTSAHHRPVGTDAQYAADSHATNIAWQYENLTTLNVGPSSGVGLYKNSASDPIRSVTWNNLKNGLNLPWNNHHIPTISIDTAGTDNTVVIYNYEDGNCYEFFGWRWNGGAPTASVLRIWPPTGAGHASTRTGTSASGVAAMFGAVRSHEINDDTTGPIRHAMQLACRANSTQIKMANSSVWPAMAKDFFCDGITTCTGAIPYGSLFALPQSTYTDAVIDTTLGLSELGKRLAKQMRDYGIYTIDNATGTTIRADQDITIDKKNEFIAQMRIIYPLMRCILNNSSTQTASGGGTAIAINGAFDAPVTAPPSVVIDGKTYSLTWSDDFNGTSIDNSKWVIIDIGVTAWHSGTFNPAIATPHVQDSILHCPIVLSGGTWYNSGVQTLNDVTHDLKRGFPLNSYVEARVKMPTGVLPVGGGTKTGIWSAGWFMPARQIGDVDYYYDYGGGNLSYWPTGGEIDWWETQRDDAWTGTGAMMWSTYLTATNDNPANATWVNKYRSAADIGVADLQTDWHTVSIHRYHDGTTVHIITRIDGQIINHSFGGDFTTGRVWDGDYHTNNAISQWAKLAVQAGTHGTGPQGSPFDKQFYLIFMGVAKDGGPVGQDVEPNPSNSGISLQIDWVKLYT